MASITTNTDIQAGAVHLLKTAGNSVLNMFQAVGNFFVMLAETNSRAQAVERLNAMSDAQLAARGLKREDIVRHIFKDMFYI